MEKISYSSTWRASKKAGVISFIRDLAWMHDLELETQEEALGRAVRGRFKVSGCEKRVDAFILDMNEGVERFNKRR